MFIPNGYEMDTGGTIRYVGPRFEDTTTENRQMDEVKVKRVFVFPPHEPAKVG